MDNADIQKIEGIIRDRQDAHAFLVNRSKPYRSFVTLEQNTFKDGRLPRVQKELIAIGISVVINCESCMEWHISEALRLGASEAEVIEAIEVAFEMGGGPATASGRFALKVLQYRKEKGSTPAGAE